jgi:hypothetical protein
MKERRKLAHVRKQPRARAVDLAAQHMRAEIRVRGMLSETLFEARA